MLKCFFLICIIGIQISVLTEFLPPIMNTALSSLLFDSSVTNKQLGDQKLGNMGIWIVRHSFYNEKTGLCICCM